MAALIVKLARRFNVPVVEKPTLARVLSTLDTDQHIPQSLYEAVALLINEIERRL